MITSNVIHRVFRIRFGQAEGTAFVIEVDGREYLVTAKHIMESLVGKGNLDLFSNGSWKSIPIQLVGHANTDIDISVVASTTCLVPHHLPLAPNMDGLSYGQDVYFLGFPYGFLGRYILGSSGYPLPFVKRAIVSQLDDSSLFLDGHNNPGFSGGPVVFRRGTSSVFQVAAVVSGYRFTKEPIYSPAGKTELIYQNNTGIIVCHTISAGVELAKANPIGSKAFVPKT